MSCCEKTHHFFNLHLLQHHFARQGQEHQEGQQLQHIHPCHRQQPMSTALILPRVTTNNADGKLTTTQLPFQSPPQGKDHNDCKGGAQYKWWIYIVIEFFIPGGILKYILIWVATKSAPFLLRFKTSVANFSCCLMHIQAGNKWYW